MLSAIMFPALFALVFLGLPVGFSLMVVAFLFGIPFFGDRIGIQLFSRLVEISSNFTLSAIPLFILMGSILERSGIAERVFQAMLIWVGRLPGGLSVAAIAMCAIFAASTGIFGAVEVVVGLMAIPVMMERKYNHGLISGTICAGGSLGTIIPPSVTVVVYATVTDLSIGDLFAGIMLPGLLMTALFIGYVIVRCWLRPEDGPPVAVGAFSHMTLGHKLRVTAAAILPAIALIAAVLGSILGGVASPTEASAVGVLGALLLTAAFGRLSLATVVDALRNTVTLNAVIVIILAAGTMFSSVFIVNGGRSLVTTTIAAMDLPPWAIVTLFLSILVLLGFVIDWVSMILVCIPIFHPIVVSLGYDPVWFAALVAIVIQTSYLTPPMAPAIFYLRTIAPPAITLVEMYRGVMPFVGLQLFVVAAVMMSPGLALWLPGLLFD